MSTSAWVMITDDYLSTLDREETRTEPILDFSRTPAFDFPVAKRSYDPSLNQFVDRFIRVCLEGRYSEFRMMYTRRFEPPPARRFVAMFNAVRAVRLVSLDKLPPLPQVAGPAYRMVAEYDLEPFAAQNRPTRRVQVAVVQEDGQWVIAPLPSEWARQLDELLSGTTRPAGEAEDESL